MNNAKKEAYNIFGKMYYEIEKATAGLFEEEVLYVKARKTAAKQCALIDINNTINALETYDDMTERHLKREFPNYLSCELQNMEQDFRYYEQVKKEIEKL